MESVRNRARGNIPEKFVLSLTTVDPPHRYRLTCRTLPRPAYPFVRRDIQIYLVIQHAAGMEHSIAHVGSTGARVDTRG